MKRMILSFYVVALLLLALSLSVHAIDIPPGPVTGTWTAANNPYNILGEINVPAGQSLLIEPGVQVIFQGHYKFIVNANATLKALGTEQDSILFTAINPTTGWHGIRFLSASAACSIKFCALRYGKATGSSYDTFGGALFVQNTNPVVQNCIIENCFAGGYAGAIYLEASNPLISDNIMQNNTVVGSNTRGGAIYGTGAGGIIRNNLIIGNSCMGSFYAQGGGVCLNGSTALSVINCTISGNIVVNGDGGGISISGSGPSVKNCIIWGNNYSQIYTYQSNAIFSYYCVQGSWPGTGNINSDPLFVNGAAGSYYLRQQPCQPLPQSPCVNAGDSASSMIIGTTRTDGVQDAGIVDMGYHYPLFTSSTLEIVLTPLNPPIVVPANGGSFSFDVTLHNNSDTVQVFEVWTIIETPQSAFVPSLGPFPLSFPPGFSLTRTRTQTVPPFAPAGDYIYWGYVGDYPWVVVNSDSFTFTKSASGEGMEGPFSEWLCTGESFPGEELGGGRTPALQEGINLLNISPNPFNPSTAISYKLQAASCVSLRVYDTAGRLVETPVDGWRGAGEHQVTFDGSHLPSGIYLYRLQAGDFTGAGKMVLLK